MRVKQTLLISSMVIGLGVLGAGYCIGKSFYLAKKLNRTVTVKGIAEQNVKSDLGVWEINYREVGNDLIVLDQHLQRDEQAVVAFLKEQGFTEDEMERTQLRVEDRLANIYNQTAAQSQNDQRYVVTGGTRIRSNKVDVMRKTQQLIDKLLQLGVPLSFDSSSFTPNPSYFYTQLDSIRPRMLADATKSARTVAAQFAKDSDSQLGVIQHASQGLFQVMGRDSSTMTAEGSIDKTVRLVTTIDYELR